MSGKANVRCDGAQPVGGGIGSFLSPDGEPSGRIAMMAGNFERVLQGLAEAREFATAYRFEMTDEYRALIVQVEALPRNQAGTDKSGRWLGSRAAQRGFRAEVTLLPRKR